MSSVVRERAASSRNKIMDFLHRIQPSLCHEASHMHIKREPCPAVECQLCQNYPIPNIYEYVHQMANTDFVEACHVAQLYCEMTGDGEIPVPFVVIGLDGIKSERVNGQTLNRLKAAATLLKALIAPFTAQSDACDISKLNDYMDDYFQLIQTQLKGMEFKPTEKLVVRQLFQHMHQVMDSKDYREEKFNYYFDTLVPFVKTYHSQTWPRLDACQEPNLVKQIIHLLKQSQWIRQTFGCYSFSLDLFHTLAACYVCSSDFNVVTNWALDFLVCICRGKYFWKNFEFTPTIQQARKILKTEVTYKRNTDLYYVLREMQKDDAMESMSENWQKYSQLTKLIMEKIQAPPELESLLTSNLFPNILFDNSTQQLAFSLAMAYASRSCHSKTGQFAKGAFSRARRLYHTIIDLINILLKFDAEYVLPWTVETLEMFTVSDPKIETAIESLAGVVFENDEEE